MVKPNKGKLSVATLSLKWRSEQKFREKACNSLRGLSEKQLFYLVWVLNTSSQNPVFHDHAHGQEGQISRYFDGIMVQEANWRILRVQQQFWQSETYFQLCSFQ